MTAHDRLLVVEDDAGFRRLLVSLLSPHFTVDAVALGRTARAHARAAPPVAAVVDLGLPDEDGVELTRGLLALAPALPIVVLTIEDARERVFAALTAGASGYVLKDRVVPELLPAIAAVREGDTALSPRVASHLLAELRASTTAPKPPGDVRITPAERRVLEELARGLTYAQIGLVLDVSVNTVRTRVRALYEKLGAASRTEAVVAAADHGLLRWPSRSGR